MTKQLVSGREAWAKAVRDRILDKKERTKYLDNIQEQLVIRLELQSHRFVVMAIDALAKKVTQIARSLEALEVNLSNLSKLIEDRIKRLKNFEGRSIFIQSAMPFGEFGRWLGQLNFTEKFKLDPASLTPEAVYDAVTRDIRPNLEMGLKSLHLIDNAKHNKTLHPRIETLTTIASPIMQFIEGGPDPSELGPKYFVAGDFPNATDNAEIQAFIRERFHGFSQAPVPVHTGNPHALIVCQMISGFSAGHWHKYEKAHEHYSKHEWIYHALPQSEMDKMPALVGRDQQGEDDLVTFGLGLMMNFIDERGNNYYGNIETRSPPPSQGPACTYLTWSKNRFKAAEALIHNGLAADTQNYRVHAANQLGNSLEAAIEAFGDEKWETLKKSIRETFDDFDRAHLSHQGSRDLINEYIKTVLGSKAATAVEPTRRELLRSLVRALNSYATSELS